MHVPDYVHYRVCMCMYTCTCVCVYIYMHTHSHISSLTGVQVQEQIHCLVGWLSKRPPGFIDLVTRLGLGLLPLPQTLQLHGLSDVRIVFCPPRAAASVPAAEACLTERTGARWPSRLPLSWASLAPGLPSSPLW